MSNKPYTLDPVWNTRMLWFVDCSSGSRASFSTTWDAARWINSNANAREYTKAVHLPSGIQALLPAVVKQSKDVIQKRKPRTVDDRVRTRDTDIKAVIAALRFVVPPHMVEDL